ncbi:MAG: hypothetical protein PUP93_29290 [Rhizonema sp. NSF051]|nr:hypothetical protein [Rhizonema sp. NSF051]
MHLNKPLILMGAVSLVTLSGVAVSPALADTPYQDYRIHREHEIRRAEQIRWEREHRVYEARRAEEIRREREHRAYEARLHGW